jgi:hypothetical protein
LKVLVNGIGIKSSGGLVVLEKLFKECLEVAAENKFIFILTSSPAMTSLTRRYQNYYIFEFRLLEIKGYIHRLYFENVVFKSIVSQSDIDLIYNFTGSTQLFLDCPQLVKIQNLLLYSKRLNKKYRENFKFILWIRQVLLKGFVFRFLLGRAKYIEVQSKHVEGYLSDFINLTNKRVFVKSDIEVVDCSIKVSKSYDFSKKIKFLYIVGPHFDYMHKNFLDFTRCMVDLIKLGIDFEINTTLTNEQLNNSKVWDTSLNSKTNFLGYVSDQEKITELFCDNTILISTSIIETLGLHVIEGIKNGVITIAPDEEYANTVYGDNMFKYELFNKDSLVSVIMSIINFKESYSGKILSIQDDLRQSERSKYSNVLDIFNEVINVQK